MFHVKPTVLNLLTQLGIPYRADAPASRWNTKCPRCSFMRGRNRRKNCLAVKVHEEKLAWRCHHCGWKGSRGKARE
jgi:hypothetical protein